MLKPLPVLATLVALTIPAPAADRPNVVLIMADDLGYHDLSCYGHAQIKTPVLDRLANDGIRLTSFYAGATVCTPSRMALMTGAYPIRLGWTQGVVGYLMSRNVGLSPNALTMAEVFKTRGYRTAICGKWHLGSRGPLLPDRQGFDFSYYIKSSNNQTKKLWRGNELVEDPFNNRLLTEKFTREAVQFIRDNKARPFFLYVPYSAPHFPVQAHPDWKGKSAYGVFGDVVEEMDHRIGEILQALDDEKIAQKTIVVFLSDNGPEPGTKASKATPLRGRKWSSLEGGTRVPCIARWPGVIPKGRTSDAMVAAIDLLPTLTAACGIDVAKISTRSPPIDGVNVWPTWIGTTAAEHPRKDLLYWHGRNGFEAIRVGDWKLFLQRKATGLEGKAKGPALFHLAEDIEEKNDVSARHPERVRAMRELAEKRLAEIRSGIIPLVEAPPPR